MSREEGREIAASIGRILLQEWDPLGIRDVPACAGEYDSYVGGVYRLLAGGADQTAVAEHLRRVESESLGRGERSLDQLLPPARTLVSLRGTLAGLSAVGGGNQGRAPS